MISWFRAAFGVSFGILTSLGLASTGAARADTRVDLQLILAVDVSGSVDGHDYGLQISGISSALQDAVVLAAIQSGPNARIAVSLVLWSDPSKPKYATPWHVLSDRKSVSVFANLVENLPRRGSGGTGIGKALQFCIAHFEHNGMQGGRRVIDLSGDGAETAFGDWSVLPRVSRRSAADRNITINALAIMTDDRTLDTYYRNEVIVGSDAFVITVETLGDFTDAMRRKLLREISNRPNDQGQFADRG